jgi:poly(3-hydroxybutyrate) depolymerase
VLAPVGRYGRAPFHLDPIQHAIATGRWSAPLDGDVVKAASGETRRWETLKADPAGTFRSSALAGGYAFVVVPSDRPRDVLLAANRHSMAYVNGEPRPGDVYGYGYVRLPVRLRKGNNLLLFAVPRGEFTVRLTQPSGPAVLNLDDATVPDRLAGPNDSAWAAVPVANLRAEGPLEIEAVAPDGASIRTPISAPPGASTKAPFRLPAGRAEGEVQQVRLRLIGDGRTLDQQVLTLRVRRPEQTRKVTFRSSIDGSVQYYAINPSAAPELAQALVLTLHGASVEAIGQADAYAPKTWAHVVAPTNRRPFGFDWEDWGRLDALEVLGDARKRLRTWTPRTYLTGHSMGGHGTWHLGVTFPGHWAAIAPSAGWISFFSYAGARRDETQDPIERMLQRGTNPSDTLVLAENLAGKPIYVLHGEKDDNVPPTESRTMVAHLKSLGIEATYHEQPDAGHWWGNECVDWPPIFAMFERSRTDVSPDRVRFVTADPGVSATRAWATVLQQTRPLEFSRVDLRRDARVATGTTENVRALRLDDLGDRMVELDGQRLRPLPGGHFVRDGETWRAEARAPGGRAMGLIGPFKNAFTNGFVLVYGTGGTPSEQAWMRAKARYDAETFWYRGNASPRVMSDAEWLAAPSAGNVIVYGNADANRAWAGLLADSPLRLESGVARFGDRLERGADLGALFVYPNGDRLVGAIGGSGIVGMRATERMPYFLSGVAYPDAVVFRADALRDGARAVLVAGYFGPDWSWSKGDWASRPSE